jgi:hypothetical protein
MSNQLSYQYVYNFIKSKGDKLISKEYSGCRNKLEIQCGKCNKTYTKAYTAFYAGQRHPYCEIRETPLFGGYKTPRRLVPIECPICKEEFQPTRSSAKLCSKQCSNDLWRTEEYRKNAKENGKIGGKISATSQSRRSKNEIYFSELCSTSFIITTNEPFFDGWDADIIIHSDKIAILWNGPWHYQQISKTQSLKQVQTRDKIKMDMIEKKGYTPYIIKDMGRYSKKFVTQEFEIFLFMRINYE